MPSRMQELTLDSLSLVTGGQQAQPAAPAPAAPSQDTYITSKELEDRLEREERFQRRERFRAWEKRHPFQAFICQGDMDCAGFD